MPGRFTSDEIPQRLMKNTVRGACFPAIVFLCKLEPILTKRDDPVIYIYLVKKGLFFQYSDSFLIERCLTLIEVAGISKH